MAKERMIVNTEDMYTNGRLTVDTRAAALAASMRRFLMWFFKALVPSGFDPEETVFFILSSSAMAEAAVTRLSFI
jgi:hypothetical protein